MRLSQWIYVILSLTCLSAGLAERAFAKEPSKKNQNKAAQVPQAPIINEGLTKNFQALYERFEKGELKKKALWEALQPFEANPQELASIEQTRYYKLRAELLFQSGFPMLSAEFAAKALTLAKEPFHEEYDVLWSNLWTVSKVKTSHAILEELALQLANRDGMVPHFGSNWNYILGNAYLRLTKIKDAKDAYEKLVMQDRYYMPAQYQLALLSIQGKKVDEAESYLKAILSPTVQDLSDLRRSEIFSLNNYAKMALGRLYYQEGRFVDAVKQYRLVPRASHLFYDALFEQSWALFMAGSIKHGLGTLYGANSPYFTNRFNPEAKVLESMMYYWMCRYDDARVALADFSEKHREAVDSLAGFLDRQRLSSDTAYTLFENLIAGVSAESLGIPLNVLKTAAESDAMLLARDQYANYIEEQSALDTYGIFGITKDIDPYKKILKGRIDKLRTDLGSLYLAELKELKDQFEEIYSQSQFLYLELLMSQKEQILGRELHAESKVTRVTDKDAFAGWSRKTQSWQDSKFEYWWDELGFHVIDVEPECKI